MKQPDKLSFSQQELDDPEPEPSGVQSIDELISLTHAINEQFALFFEARRSGRAKEAAEIRFSIHNDQIRLLGQRAAVDSLVKQLYPHVAEEIDHAIQLTKQYSANHHRAVYGKRPTR
jgi:hypothetical protein